MRPSIALLILFASGSLCAQPSYTLNAWYWHRHLSTTDSIYVQDVDLPDHQVFIPIHLSPADFRLLDSVATSIGFWSLPDTIQDRPPETIGGVVFGSASLPGPGRTEFEFVTPTRRKHILVNSWPDNEGARVTLQKLETAINLVLERQPYYNTLPPSQIRQ